MPAVPSAATTPATISQIKADEDSCFVVAVGARDGWAGVPLGFAVGDGCVAGPVAGALGLVEGGTDGVTDGATDVPGTVTVCRHQTTLPSRTPATFRVCWPGSRPAGTTTRKLDVPGRDR